MGSANVTVRAYVPADHAALMALLADPSLAGEYARLVAAGEFHDPLSHPVLHPGGMWLTEAGEESGGDDAVVAFGMLLVMPSVRGPWAHLRLGVLRSCRRRGIGTALLRAAEAAIARIPADRAPSMLMVGAWHPAEEATAFLERHGFAHYRFWWEMERPLGVVPEPVWPKGVELRLFDGSEHAFAEWTACYNDAFAQRFPSHLATVEEARRITSAPGFRADGLLLAWQGDRCVGFSRNTLMDGHGEVDVLGVRPEAQGRGLGRALLRWGVAWLEAQGTPHVRLIVDGANEGALTLYRSEGFEIAATRQTWKRGGAGDEEEKS